MPTINLSTQQIIYASRRILGQETAIALEAAHGGCSSAMCRQTFPKATSIKVIPWEENPVNYISGYAFEFDNDEDAMLCRMLA
jgi:hypothetical protein